MERDGKIEEEVAVEAQRLIAEYPRREIQIEAMHETRDMSIVGKFSQKTVIPFDKICKGEALDTAALKCGKVKVVDVSEERVALWWEPKEYEVELGKRVETDRYAIDNPFLTQETLGLAFEYRYVTLKGKMFDILKEISDTHARCEKSIYPETAHRESLVLQLLDKLIKDKNVELYVLKAILAASNNWATGVFVRPSLFREILLEGVENGCLAPENEAAWLWVETAAENNDPTEFMDDMERWYDLLATAAEHGNNIALDIMNSIWEPEQIIEED